MMDKDINISPATFMAQMLPGHVCDQDGIPAGFCVEQGRQDERRNGRYCMIAFFPGHDVGAEHGVVIASLIDTCKMNAVDPHAWLTTTLIATVEGHKQSQIDYLLL